VLPHTLTFGRKGALTRSAVVAYHRRKGARASAVSLGTERRRLRARVTSAEFADAAAWAGGGRHSSSCGNKGSSRMEQQSDPLEGTVQELEGNGDSRPDCWRPPRRYISAVQRHEADIRGPLAVAADFSYTFRGQ